MQSILVVLAGFLLFHDVQSSTSIDNCRILIDGASANKSQTRCKFEYSANIEPKSVTVVGGGSECNLRILAVGGGGQRLKDASGAGSGHLKYLSLSLANFNSSLSLRAEVGNYGQATNISVNGDVTTAAPGQPAYHRWVGDKSHGGNGYSGGGGCCSDHYDDCQHINVNGGQGGSDGNGPTSVSEPGKGSGEDLGLYAMNQWKLSPGEGGEAYAAGDGWYYGGGGGGVMVDGVGPERDSNNTGQGYGGGCGGGTYHYRNGHPGVILIEVGP